MSTVTVPCPLCAHQIDPGVSRAGETLTCPKCTKPLVVFDTGSKRILVRQARPQPMTPPTRRSTPSTAVSKTQPLLAKKPARAYQKGTVSPIVSKLPAKTRPTSPSHSAPHPTHAPRQAGKSTAAATAKVSRGKPRSFAYEKARWGLAGTTVLLLLTAGLSLALRRNPPSAAEIGKNQSLAASELPSERAAAIPPPEQQPPDISTELPDPPERTPGAPTVQPNVAPSDPVKSVEEIVAELDPSVCCVLTSTSTGSGFVVGPSLIATNKHVIGETDAGEMVIEFPTRGEEQYQVEEIAYSNEQIDLVLLRVSSLPSDITPIRIQPSAELKKGEQIIVIGSPGGLRNAVTVGYFGSVQELDGQKYLQLSVAVNPGNSGGPALTRGGKLAGVVTMKAATQEGIGYAIPADLVLAALEE